MKILINSVLALAALTAAHVHASESYLNTKFGTLAVSNEKILHFNGRPVTPVIFGRLHIDKSFNFGQKIVVIVHNLGGTSCPMQINFIVIDKNTAKSSPSFGTCTETYDVNTRNNSIIVKMDDDAGVHEYIYADGVITDNGEVIKDSFSTKPFSVNAMINDPDGYTNVRQAANVKSQIVSRVSKEEFFQTHSQNSEWWQVRLNSGAIGYMHKSRILMIRDF